MERTLDNLVEVPNLDHKYISIKSRKDIIGNRFNLFPMIILLFFLTSCSFFPPDNKAKGTASDFATPIVVTQIVASTFTLTPSPTCSPLPSGIKVVLTPLSHFDVKIELFGFQPRENVTLIFTTQNQISSTRYLIGPFKVDEQGNYQTSNGFSSSPDRPNIKWQVQVLYSKGAYCTEIEMPAPSR